LESTPTAVKVLWQVLPSAGTTLTRMACSIRVSLHAESFTAHVAAGLWVLLVCAVVCGPREGPYVACGLTSYRISPRSPEANARVPCESSRRRLHLSARIPVPPLLAAPTSFASITDADLCRLISRARIWPLLAMASLPPPLPS
jgi:hypothetical protein